MVDKGLGLGEAEVNELSSGVEPVTGLGALEPALHGGDEEADDESAALSLLPHYLLYRGRAMAGRLFLLALLQVSVGVGCWEHMSYCRRRAGVRQGLLRRAAGRVPRKELLKLGNVSNPVSPARGRGPSSLSPEGPCERER